MTERAKPPGGSASKAWEVPSSLGGRPLDAVLRSLTEASWSTVRGWIRSGKITFEGELATDERRPVRAGARLRFEPNAPRPQTRRLAAFGEDRIVHLDPSVVVVDKPAGINSVPYGDEAHGEMTLDAFVREIIDRRSQRGGGTRGRPPLGVVHRIDRPTTGLLVFTRSLAAKQHLAQQFRVHSVHRRYLAIVHGEVEQRTIRSLIAEDRGDGLRGAALRGPRRGQAAVTHVEPIERLRGATLVACRLETGRTHQIRIHLAEAGHPLLGETVYARGAAHPMLPAPRLMLHAEELGFEHPATGERLHFRRDPPADFAAVAAALRGPAHPSPKAGKHRPASRVGGRRTGGSR